MPDKLLAPVPYVGPASKAIPGDKKAVVFAGELSEGQTPGGQSTNIAHGSVALSTSTKSVDVSDKIEQGIEGALEKIPVPPKVKQQIQKQFEAQLPQLLEAKGPDGKPLLSTAGKAGAKVTLQFDVVVETAKDNPLDVKSVEVYATLKGKVSAAGEATSPRLPPGIGKFIKGKTDVSLESSALLSVRYEAPSDAKPPQVIDKGDSFTRLNQGDIRTAFNVTEELLQGIASVRYEDGSVEHGIPVSEGTSVWDLSRVAEGRNHGHQALDLANQVHEVLHEAGALAPDEYLQNTDQAVAALDEVFAAATPEECAEMADELANPLGLNFGIPEIAARNDELAAAQPLPTAEHFAQYF